MIGIARTSVRPPVSDVKAFRQHVEDHARKLRRRAGVDSESPLDPRLLADELKIRIVSLDQIDGLSQDDLEHLLQVDARVWSGAGMPMADGSTLVLLHPLQTRERATATIMEEVCHAYYKHRPTRLLTLPGGMSKREYDREMEAEAYWTGAAALLPAKVVAKAVWTRRANRLASDYGVSVELVEFRIKTLWLWKEYVRTSSN